MVSAQGAFEEKVEQTVQRLEKFALQQDEANEEVLVKSIAPRLTAIEEELNLMFTTFTSFRDKQKGDSHALNQLESDFEAFRNSNGLPGTPLPDLESL